MEHVESTDFFIDESGCLYVYDPVHNYFVPTTNGSF